MKLSRELQTTQALIHSPEMRQALHVLQLPIMELSALIEQEIEENPLLEWDEDEVSTFVESALETNGSDAVEATPSLFDFLMTQAKQHLEKRDLEACFHLIGSLDERGFLSGDLLEVARSSGINLTHLEEVLEKIQNLDPPGIAARSLQHSLLIQLKRQNRRKSLAYLIIEKHFDDLLHNRLPLIAKKTKVPLAELNQCLTVIAHLNFRPASGYARGSTKEILQHICPDVSIAGNSIIVNEKDIPSFRLKKHYMKLLANADEPDTKQYIQSKLKSAQWLRRNLDERNSTLYRITEQIMLLQKDFLAGGPGQSGQLHPMTMKEMSSLLSLHESTIARAVANKYIDCAHGLLPLRSFFTREMSTLDHKLCSNQSIKEMIGKLICEEDKRQPLSDAKITHLLKENGFACARRTVTKYREELKIAKVAIRKTH